MKISVLTTLYHSSAYIHEFYNRSLASVKKTGLDYEFIFVNDGSPDDSTEKVLALTKSDPKVVLVDLSRNFGHAKAIMTGLQHCTGDFVYLIDCDLEEDPELFEPFWEKLQGDTSLDVVYGIQVKRKGGWFERTSGWLFYKFISSLTSVDYPSNSLTARIMTRRYVESVIQYKERELEIWGIFVLSGFKQLAVPASKKSKGSTTYTFSRKLAVAIDAITSLSNRPLYFTFVLGFLSFFFAIIYVGVIVYKKMVLGVDIEGWASTVASIWLVGGMILFVLGIFGIYLSKMFNEIKARPLSIVRKSTIRMLNKSEINDFYRERLHEHGASAEGVGWRDQSAQEIRFRQLLKVIDTDKPFTINDLGCGTGDLIKLLDSWYREQYTYTGYDTLDEMVFLARQQFKKSKSAEFHLLTDYKQLTPKDYSVASGIFNVRNSISNDEWQAYIMKTIHALNDCSEKGFAFNALTKYSDADKMRPELYYSDPLFLFDYCKKNFSKNVALFHDYTIYDFTIVVRKS